MSFKEMFEIEAVPHRGGARQNQARLDVDESDGRLRDPPYGSSHRDGFVDTARALESPISS